MSEIKTGPNTEAAKQLIQICAETIFAPNAKQLQRVEAFLDELTGISLPPIIPTATDAECAAKAARIAQMEREAHDNARIIGMSGSREARHLAIIAEKDAEIKRLRRALEKMPCESRFKTLFVHDPDCIKCATLSSPRQPGGEGVGT